jgi:hypothetical protein
VMTTENAYALASSHFKLCHIEGLTILVANPI